MLCAIVFQAQLPECYDKARSAFNFRTSSKLSWNSSVAPRLTSFCLERFDFNRVRLLKRLPDVEMLRDFKPHMAVRHVDTVLVYMCLYFIVYMFMYTYVYCSLP